MEAFPILLLWKRDTCMVMMHVSLDFWLMQSWRHREPSFKVCYFAVGKNVRGCNSGSVHRIGMKLQHILDYDTSLRFLLMTLTFHKGQGHMTLETEISKISIFHKILKLRQFWFLCNEDHYILVIICKFHNYMSKIKAVMASQTCLPYSQKRLL